MQRGYNTIPQIERMKLLQSELADPVSWWVVVTTVGTVIGAIASVADTVLTDRSLREINGKLDGILDNQVQILEEIRKSKIFFRRELLAAFVNDVTKDMQAQVNRFTVATSTIDDPSQISSAEAKRLENLLPEIEQTAFKLLAYGAASYQPTMVAFTLLKVMYDLLKVDDRIKHSAFSILNKDLLNPHFPSKALISLS